MANRDKQKVALLKSSAERKEQARQKVIDAVQKLKQAGQIVSFPNVARVAGGSKSYLNKWPEVKTYIQEARDIKTGKDFLIPKERETGPYSLKTRHEIDRNRIKVLEAEIEELKRQNQLLLGHVAEIYELRDECERLRSRVRAITNPAQKASVLQAVPKQTAAAADKQKYKDIPQDILDAVEKLGIKLGVRLVKSLRQNPPEQIRSAIAAFEQYRLTTVIESPAACLKAMIEEGAEPNVRLEPSKDEDDEFDMWYGEAIREGFCLDVPKGHLSKIGSEYQVKVIDLSAAGGYLPMSWKEAEKLRM